MKIDISRIHLETLDSDRQEVLERLVLYTKQFVLGGGTALAMQIAHRRSFDFDFFSAGAIQTDLLENLRAVVKIETPLVDKSDELSIMLPKDIKVTFLKYAFPRHFDLLELPSGLKLFSAKEIALQKAYTIGRRGEYRDIFDLYSLLSRNIIDLSEIIAATKKTYNGLFSAKLFLEQLVYFEDFRNLTIIPVSADQKLPIPDEVKSYFENLVRDYLTHL